MTDRNPTNRQPFGDKEMDVPDTFGTRAPLVGLAAFIADVVAAPARPGLRALVANTEWAISVEMAQVLEGLVLHLRPSSILEFGAGRSSLVLASALQTCGRGRLTSIEHQPEFAESAFQQVRQYDAVDARMLHAPLTLRFSKHGLLHSYTGIGSTLRGRGPFDMVFIDAPPGHLGRDSTLLSAAAFLTPSAIVVLDDAARPAEKTAVRRWERSVRVNRLYESDRVGRGIVVLEVQPGVPEFSWRTFAGTIHDRLIAWRGTRGA